MNKETLPTLVLQSASAATRSDFNEHYLLEDRRPDWWTEVVRKPLKINEVGFVCLNYQSIETSERAILEFVSARILPDFYVSPSTLCSLHNQFCGLGIRFIFADRRRIKRLRRKTIEGAYPISLSSIITTDAKSIFNNYELEPKIYVTVTGDDNLKRLKKYLDVAGVCYVQNRTNHFIVIIKHSNNWSDAQFYDLMQILSYHDHSFDLELTCLTQRVQTTIPKKYLQRCIDMGATLRISVVLAVSKQTDFVHYPPFC